MVPLLALVALFLVVPIHTTAGAQYLTQKPVVPLQASRLWIEGKTTVSDYSCEAKVINGYGYAKTPSEPDQPLDLKARVEVRIPVKQLDCGKEGMNRDMYRALKASEYPHIHYKLIETKQMQEDMNKSKGWVMVRATGELTIAGTTRRVDILVKGRKKSDAIIQVRGEKKLNMRAFGIRPPTALFGLIEAHQELTVHFDLLAAPSDTLTLKRSEW